MQVTTNRSVRENDVKIGGQVYQQSQTGLHTVTVQQIIQYQV
jgi:hypothetical protein